MWWLTGIAPHRLLRPGSNPALFYNDPDALQDHCANTVKFQGSEEDLPVKQKRKKKEELRHT